MRARARLARRKARASERAVTGDARVRERTAMLPRVGVAAVTFRLPPDVLTLPSDVAQCAAAAVAVARTAEEAAAEDGRVRRGGGANDVRPPEHQRRAAAAAPLSLPPPPCCLVARRAKRPARGLWSFPGGSLHFGESVHRGTARELREETGLVDGRDVRVGPVLATVDAIYLPDTHFVVLDSVAFALHDADVCAADDVDDVRWAAPDALLDDNGGRGAGGENGAAFACTPGARLVAQQVWDRVAAWYR